MFWQVFFGVLAAVLVYKFIQANVRARREGYGNNWGLMVAIGASIAAIAFAKWALTASR